ncbi:PKD domain-containing protein [Aeromicrobium sp.]|uniref:PKD domain-containing protein n=1 Tax=Aeromicrobium sp. TaxID=1871063 RepID=UPI0030C041F4
MTRRRRRLALAALLAMVTIPLVTSSAQAAACQPGDSCVTIEYVSTKDGVANRVVGPYTYAINKDPALVAEGKPYTIRTKPGGPATPIREGGIPNTLPLSALVAQSDAEPNNQVRNDVTFSETPGLDKVPAVLSPARLRGTSPYADNLVPAVYVADDGGVGYVRPLADGTKDVNALEVFATEPGTPLTLTFHVTGELVSATIKSSPAKPTTAGPVSFSAEIGSDSDESFSYAWNFVGKSDVQSKKAAPTYTYTRKDSYSVNLSVRGDDGSYGRASTATVKVGNVPKSSSNGTGNGTGTGGTGGGAGGAGGGTGYTPPYDPSTPPVADPPADATPPPDNLTPLDDGLEAVEGFVLAGAGAEEGESIPGTQATSQPTQATELSAGRKINGAVIGTLAVMLLLGLGAEIEARWVSNRLGHLRRRT